MKTLSEQEAVISRKMLENSNYIMDGSSPKKSDHQSLKKNKIKKIRKLYFDTKVLNYICNQLCESIIIKY